MPNEPVPDQPTADAGRDVLATPLSRVHRAFSERLAKEEVLSADAKRNLSNLVARGTLPTVEEILAILRRD